MRYPSQTEGQEVVRAWRQKYHERPPEMDEEHPHWPLMAEDRRYTVSACLGGVWLDMWVVGVFVSVGGG